MPIWVSHFPQSIAERTLATLPEPCQMARVETELRGATLVFMSWVNAHRREAKAITAFNYFCQVTDK